MKYWFLFIITIGSILIVAYPSVNSIGNLYFGIFLMIIGSLGLFWKKRK